MAKKTPSSALIVDFPQQCIHPKHATHHMTLAASESESEREKTSSTNLPNSTLVFFSFLRVSSSPTMRCLQKIYTDLHTKTEHKQIIK